MDSNSDFEKMTNRLLKYQKRANKHSELAHDLELVISNCDIPTNYQMSIIESISAHKKCARHNNQKCIEILNNEPA